MCKVTINKETNVKANLKMWSKFAANIRRRSSMFAGFYNYTVFVQTGDQINAGTDANVYVILHGERGQASNEIKLTTLFRDNFERGRMDRFKVKYQPVSKVYAGNICCAVVVVFSMCGCLFVISSRWYMFHFQWGIVLI